MKINVKPSSEIQLFIHLKNSFVSQGKKTFFSDEKLKNVRCILKISVGLWIKQFNLLYFIAGPFTFSRLFYANIYVGHGLVMGFLKLRIFII